MEYRFDHVAVNVKNVAASVRWYMDELGARVLYQDDTWAFLEAAGVRIALTLRSQHPAHIAFDVGPAPTQEFLQRARSHRDGTISRYVTDPDGNAVEWIYYPESSIPEIRPRQRAGLGDDAVPPGEDSGV